MWCNFTQQEVFTIKNTLRGSLSIGIHEGFGKDYREYLNNFQTFAEEITGERSIYESNRRFLHTAYAYDSIKVYANALDSLIEERVNETFLPSIQINITSTDRIALAEVLSKSTIEGVTGKIRFSENSQRADLVYAVRNFVPKDNGFNVNNSLSLDPWVVQVRGWLKIGMDPPELKYLDENQSVSDTITIVFSDGSHSIPPDRPRQFFVRSK